MRIICATLLMLTFSLRADDLFKDHVRPLLTEQCLNCHGGEKVKGEFDLSARAGLLHPGDDGPLVIPGNAAGSKLMRLINHLDEPHMPSKRPKLSAEQIGYIAKWIDAGAEYDKPLINKGGAAGKHSVVTAEDKKYWAFAPLKEAALPDVKNKKWVRTPIDRYILAACEAKGIEPNGIADKLKLIRRATFDLTGLPPTPQEIDAFVADSSENAYDKLVDRLLASPRFGERWARHWLDVARFAESHGYEQDYDRPYAYWYRDFVIKAFNDDLSYKTFVKWQLAGDEIAPKNEWALAATGFLGAGTHATQITASQAEKERYDELDDMANTTCTAFLGMTVGCARCHDHKYDPIPSKDYYHLIATFGTTVRGAVFWENGKGIHPLPSPPPAGNLPATQPATPYMMVCSEGIPAIRCNTQGPDFYGKTYFCKRGDVNQKDVPVSSGYLTVLENAPDGEAHWHVNPPPGAKTSFRRTALANWITDDHDGAGQLLARVIVNRLWQHHFGRGLVASPNDFGLQGEKPTHPELLDYLASELIRNGWKLKPIHRLIMTSSVYMQSSDYDDARNKVDSENQLCWRRPFLRLEAEAIRDAMLAVSGRLDYTPFGPGTLDPGMTRRSIYFFQKRSQIIPLMLLFDAPNTLSSMGSRPTTTVAPQALAMMNNAQVQANAKAFAKRVIASPDPIKQAYRLALGRLPTNEETTEAAAFMKDEGLERFCQVLFALNEFVYVD
jgi:hypothetical protein